MPNHFVLQALQQNKYEALLERDLEERQKVSKDIWELTPDADKLDVIKVAESGGVTENQIRQILEMNEGGFTPQDGKSGSPAIYGINEGASANNKVAFAEAMKITKEQGEQAGKDFAWEYYKKEYLAPYGVFDLPEDVQAIVADGVVNHGSTFARKLANAAKDGAAPEELIEMRRNEYQRLADANPEKYAGNMNGWMSRLDRLPTSNSNVFSNLAPADKMKALGDLPKYNEAAAVRLILSGGVLADPSNKKQREAVNNLFVLNGGAQQIADKTQESIPVTLDYVNKFGIIPEDAKKLLRGYMINGKPEDAQYAYGVIGEIAKSKPQALTMGGGFQEKDITNAFAFNSLIGAGATPNLAMEAIKQANQPIMKDVRNMRASEIKVEDLKPSKIVAQFDPVGFFNAPDFADNAQRDMLIADYRRVYKEAFLQYGDKEVAEGIADKSVNIYAGVSNVGGKRLMKYPPEKFYAVEGVPQDVLVDSLTKQVESDLESLGYTWKSYSLSPTLNAESKVNTGQKPAYNVWITYDDGRIDYARGEDNEPIAIEFDQKPLMDMANEGKEQYKKNAEVVRENQKFYEKYFRPEKDTSINADLVDSD
jgi:hypothetical protein